VADACSTDTSAGPRTCGLAIVSAVCGLTSVVFFLGFLSGIPAALLGHMALGRIQESGGTYKGRRLAQVGLVLGYSASIASILLWAWVLAAG
jgi:hypothetical protein